MLISAGSGTRQAQRQLNTNVRRTWDAGGDIAPQGYHSTDKHSSWVVKDKYEWALQTKPGFEVKGSGGGGLKVPVRSEGHQLGHVTDVQPQLMGGRISANFLNDALLESQQDQKNMQIFSCGGSAGYVKTGQCETAVSDSTQAQRHSHRFWPNLVLLSLYRGQNISGNTLTLTREMH